MNNTTRLPANQFPYDYALRMKQTTASILPNQLISFIIKEADGGLSTHKKKIRFCLDQIENMAQYRFRLTWEGTEDRIEEADAPWESSECPEDNIPELFPRVEFCTEGAKALRDRETTGMEAERCDWWYPGGGADSEGYRVGDVDAWYEPRFQSYLFR